MAARADAIAAKIEAFIRTEVVPYEKDPRTGPHGPSDDLVQELRDKAESRAALNGGAGTAWLAAGCRSDGRRPLNLQVSERLASSQAVGRRA